MTANDRRSLRQRLNSGNGNIISRKQVSAVREDTAENPVPWRKIHPRTGFWRKEFIARESLLTDMLQKSNDIRTLFNMSISIAIVILVETAVMLLLEDQRSRLLGYALKVFEAFSDIPMTAATWLGMMLLVLSVYIPVYLCGPWSQVNGISRLILYTVYFAQALLLIFLPIWSCLHFELLIGSRLVVATEQIRLLMKVHSFFRECNRRQRELQCRPSMSSYLYFLFAPTLIYRDSYPRNDRIDWSNVIWKLVQLSLAAVLLFRIVMHFCIEPFDGYGPDRLTLRAAITTCFQCMLPATLLKMMLFFMLLHLWCNVWAELLGFADRMFYGDWWNTRSFARYFAAWNVVVGDWLYTYLYSEVYVFLGYKFRFVAMQATFILSAIFHEYLITMIYGVVFPFMLIQFSMISVNFKYITTERYPRYSNICFWLLMWSGSGMLMQYFCSEWYARVNCPPYQDFYANLFLPRSFFCSRTLSIS